MKTTKLFICGHLIDLSLIKSIDYKDHGDTHVSENLNAYKDENHRIIINFLSGEPVAIVQERVYLFIDNSCQKDPDFEKKKRKAIENLKRIHSELVKSWSGVDKTEIPVIDYKNN